MTRSKSRAAQRVDSSDLESDDSRIIESPVKKTKTTKKKTSKAVSNMAELSVHFQNIELKLATAKERMLEQEKDMEEARLRRVEAERIAKKEAVELELQKEITLEQAKVEGQKHILELQHANHLAALDKEMELARLQAQAPSSPDRVHKKAKLQDVTNIPKAVDMPFTPAQKARWLLLEAAKPQKLTNTELETCIAYSNSLTFPIDNPSAAKLILENALQTDVVMTSG
ncbi:hypothetical protein BDZ89DRAFT_1036422 [Hymenopellis radicata]|nr:hypothetical protein BDZ89DRAFT_1041536 [Hymenopellis radicata]KAF9034698.1 hypothetical protein BDZ89DRAFT_1036422 [Hymenopellis radicata]